MRLKDKIAIVVGSGQSPGEGLGSGRATVLRFAQEGQGSGGRQQSLLRRGNGRNGTTVGCRMSFIRSGRDQRDHSQGDGRGRTTTLGRIDILHYDVGTSIAGGDALLDEITEDRSVPS
jgi:hypothetical protein